MRQKFIFLWTIVLFFTISRNVTAVYYSLSDEQIKQAIEYGEKNNDLDYIAFLGEWVMVSH